MKRLRRILTLVVLVVSAAGPLSAQDKNAESVKPRRVLFFDLSKFDAWNNVRLSQGEPEWVRECEYRDPSFPTSGVYFPSVRYDEQIGRFRLIHSVRWSPFTMMYAESDDGIHWKPVPVDNASPVGGKLAPNHVFTLPSGSGSGIYHDPETTDGFAFRILGRQSGKPVFERALADPQHRWHRIATSEGEKRYIGEGVTLVSKDGVHWQLKTGGRWDWQSEDWFPEPPVFVFRNHLTGRHVVTARPGWGDRRQCLRTTSDFVHWSEPRLQFQPDSLDTHAPIGMYGLPVTSVGNGAGYAGLLWIFRNSSSEPVSSFNQFYGEMDAELVYSYDGQRLFRTTRRPFLKRPPIPQPGCTQIRPCSIVQTDTHILIYSEAHKAPHGRERSEQRQAKDPLGSLMLHRLRKDGWMYLQPAGDRAHVQTKPFALTNPVIQINAAANFGEIRFQLTNEKSEPLPGLSFDDCIPLQRADALSHKLQWKDDAVPPINTPVRLELKFRQANIYSLTMSHHFLDAHDLWLLKDGKSLPKVRRFDF